MTGTGDTREEEKIIWIDKDPGTEHRTAEKKKKEK